jgi:hypothetical protein
MPTSLESIQQTLNRRLRVLDAGFERQLLNSDVKFRLDKSAIQEGYISALWQAWCNFCRELMIASVQGATTKSGVDTTCTHAALGEMEIAYVAKQLSNQHAVTTVRPLSGSHQEHTWGDVGKMNYVLGGIGCSNAPVIITAFSACRRIDDLQLCRNASAHICKSTIFNIRDCKVRYLDTKLRHPSDMMYWTDPDSNDFLWKSWVEEMELVAEFAIQ